MLTNLKLTNNALNTEILQVNQAKLQGPDVDRSSGTVWCKRRGGLRHQFNGRERELWSPEFYREWIEYIEAVENGELTGY